MAKKLKDDGAKVWTNVSDNPVYLGDGSVVAPGETTTEAQADLVPGSLWEQHRVLLPGSPELTEASNQVLDDLRKENESLRAELAKSADAATGLQEQVTTLQGQIEELKKQIQPAS